MSHLTLVPPATTETCDHAEHRGLAWERTLRPGHPGAHVLQAIR